MYFCLICYLLFNQSYGITKLHIKMHFIYQSYKESSLLQKMTSKDFFGVLLYVHFLCCYCCLIPYIIYLQGLVRLQNIHKQGLLFREKIQDSKGKRVQPPQTSRLTFLEVLICTKLYNVVELTITICAMNVGSREPPAGCLQQCILCPSGYLPKPSCLTCKTL